MVKENMAVKKLNVVIRTGLLGVFILGLAGCAPESYNSSNPRIIEMIRDIGDKQESQNRKVTNQIDTLRGSVDSNNEKVLALIDDMNKQLKQQQQDMDTIKARLEPQRTVTPTPTPTPGPGPGPGPEAIPGGPVTQPTNFVQALNAGRQLFGQNNFAASRDIFVTALDFAKKDTDPAVSKREQIAANYWLGEASFALKDNAAAKTSYWAAINLDNTGIDAWQSFERLGDIARAEGDNATALRNYQTILSEFQKKNSKYPGEDRVKAKIAEIQGAGGAGGGAVPPAGGDMAPAPAPAPALGPQGSFTQPGFNGN